MENDLEKKVDKAIDDIALLVVATSRDHEIYTNLVTSIISLTTELASWNKNIVEFLKENSHIEHLLVQCRIGGCTSKKTGTGGSLTDTNYSWSCGYDSRYPSFKCTDPKTGHVMNATKSNIHGGSEKNNLM